MYVTTFHLSFKVPEELENHEFLQQNAEVDQRTIIKFLAMCFANPEMKSWLNIGALSINSATMEEAQQHAEKEGIELNQAIRNEIEASLSQQLQYIVRGMVGATVEQEEEQQ